jgi:RNA polymerase sigma-70 factor (ECF subfamily)
LRKSADNVKSSRKSPEEFEGSSDKELLEWISRQERGALEALYNRYSGAVYSLAVHMLRDGGAAEEVTQDTFFNVWRRGSSYRPERGKVAAWLFSIGHHRIIDEVRRRRRREKAIVSQDVEKLDQPASDSTDPARYAYVQLLRSEIGEALSNLREEQREVVLLSYYGGLTHSEIATRLGQPLGTVKTRMRLALRKLKNILGPQAQEWAEHGL